VRSVNERVKLTSAPVFALADRLELCSGTFVARTKPLKYDARAPVPRGRSPGRTTGHHQNQAGLSPADSPAYHIGVLFVRTLAAAWSGAQRGHTVHANGSASIEVCKRADVILFDVNPLSDPMALLSDDRHQKDGVIWN
jgi:hypothetical protein